MYVTVPKNYMIHRRVQIKTIKSEPNSEAVFKFKNKFKKYIIIIYI